MLNAFMVVIEIIIFISYVLICMALFKRRFSRQATAAAFCLVLLAIVGVQTAIVLPGEATLMSTLVPLTAYLPFTAAFFFLSGGGLFENVAISFIGLLEVLVLESLKKILIYVVAAHNTWGAAIHFICSVLVALAAAGLVFITFKRLRKVFRLCIAETGHKSDLILFVPVILIFFTLFYFLSSTTDILILIFTVLTALSIFLIIAKLLNTTANLTNARQAERELHEYIDVQRRGYERVVQKMETSREYRHDMRHHLAVIEGLAKRGENDKIVEYTSNLNGSFGKLENIGYCKNSELNALLSEYIGRAENAGCKVTQSFMLPESFPFEEADVCLVLANAIDNAINACFELPSENRYIKITAGYTDVHKLLIAVENSCSGTVEFGENGLPVSAAAQGSDEHGIGLRSVKRVVEKYHGFLRCMQENGKFIFQAALFYDSGSAPKGKSAKPLKKAARVAETLLGLGLGAIVVLNASPTVADAASKLLSINIRTIHDIGFKWGSSSMDIQSPEFDGNGADKLNSAAKDYVGEAKEKFMWYFNRRYTGYVGEDMKYTVIRDDDKYFIVRFEVTVNAGGSLSYSRWINYDKSADEVLELADIFKEDSDYIGVLSAEILEQMKYKNEHENGGFFVEGADAFTEIAPDANFYIDGFDRLVIVFDEYEVAPGSVGSPEFFIPSKITEEIAR